MDWFARRLRSLIADLLDWAASTPRSALSHCGDNAVVAPHFKATYPRRVRIGDNVYIGPHAFLSSQGGLVIEDGAIFGPYVAIYTASHRFEGAEAVPYDGTIICRPVRICRNVWVGGNVVIVPGVTIGEGAVIGAGAVVTRDVPALAIAGGNPARVIRYRNASEYHRHALEGNVYMRLRGTGALSAGEALPDEFSWASDLVGLPDAAPCDDRDPAMRATED